jgi:hypothetical protein
MTLEKLTREDFAACVGESFRLCPDHPDAFDLVVEQVSELKAAEGYESFSICFRGPGDRGVPQATYPLENDRLGRLEIFIVPIARDEKGYRYEALFNRLVTE